MILFREKKKNERESFEKKQMEIENIGKDIKRINEGNNERRCLIEDYEYKNRELDIIIVNNVIDEFIR